MDDYVREATLELSVCRFGINTKKIRFEYGTNMNQRQHPAPDKEIGYHSSLAIHLQEKFGKMVRESRENL